jgi:Na+/proline symporter
MVPSYLGWVAAQLVAMAVLFNVLIGLPMGWGIMLCTVVVVIYTYIGGMWAVSVTDFVQTVLIVIGVLALAFQVGSEAGGVEAVLSSQPEGFFQFFPERNFGDWVHYLAAWMTIGLGSIPQQDVFQRFMAAKNERTAVQSGIFGGMMYLTVGFIPLFIGLCAKALHPEMLQEDDPQRMLPLMTLKYSHSGVQVLFFGAIISAILSTTSAAILAPATVVGENLVKPLYKDMSDASLLRVMRYAVIGIAIISAIIAMSGQTIYELVGQSSALSLVSLFVPLIAGLYWKRASAMGALLSIVLGFLVWGWFEFVSPGEYPSLIYGLATSFVAMVAGSLIRPVR